MDVKKVTSVPVGTSSTNFGGANAGGKAKKNGVAPRSALASGGVSMGGNKNKLPSGTYKA